MTEDFPWPMLSCMTEFSIAGEDLITAAILF